MQLEVAAGDRERGGGERRGGREGGGVVVEVRRGQTGLMGERGV